MEYAVEMRPRAGMWVPFIVGIPFAERDRVEMEVARGPRGNPTPNLMKSGPPAKQIGEWWCEMSNEEASTTLSYFLWCKDVPSKVVFGAGTGPQFEVSLTRP